MKRRVITWLPVELAWIEVRKDWPRRDLYAAFQTHFGRPEISYETFRSACKRMRILTGRTGRFVDGHTIRNGYGKGQYTPGSEKGWFRTGSRSGRANHVYKPIGTERVSAEGYIERKVNDDLPFKRRWRGVHLIRWEAINGPLPKGHALKCLDGDKANTDPSNWTLIPRALLPRLAGRSDRGRIGYDAAAPEIKPALLAIAQLEHRAREIRRGDDKTSENK